MLPVGWFGRSLFFEAVDSRFSRICAASESLQTSPIASLLALSAIMREFIREQISTVHEQYSVLIDAIAPVRFTKSELAILFVRKIQHDFLLRMEEPRTWYTAFAALILVAAIVASQLRARTSSLRRLGLPVVSAPKGAAKFDYRVILDEGARRYPHSPYLITYSGFEYVVFPPSSWDEIKRIPSTKASTLLFFTHVFFGGWRLLGSDTSALHKAIGTDLNRALPIRMKAHQESARKACESTLGSCPEWKSFRMYFTLQGIIAATNATGLVGPELGSNRGWLVAVQAFPMAIVVAISTSGLSPRLLRPLVTFFVFLPTWALYWYMRWLLQPIVNRDLREYEIASQEKEKSELTQAQPDKKFPMIAWLMSRYTPKERTPQQVAHDFIVASSNQHLPHLQPSTLLWRSS